MPEIVIRSGDELVERVVGSSANIIRKVSSVTSNIVYFQDGRHETVRTIQRSGNWSKLETIRGPYSIPEKGDTVHFRDQRRTVFFHEANRTKFTDSTSVPTNAIHYDVETNEFWYMCGLDIRVGDIVIHGKNRLTVKAVDIVAAKISFGDDLYISLDMLMIDGDARCYIISELDELKKTEVPFLKEGMTVHYKKWKFKVSLISGDRVVFEKGGEYDLSKIKHNGHEFFIPALVPFFDVEVPKTGSYWLLAGKDEEVLTEKLRYAAYKGFKLWGPTQVKGDHYAQAMRK